MQLHLEEGALIASSKFAGSAPRLVRVFNELPRARFDDDSWHTVSMQRTLQMVRVMKYNSFADAKLFIFGYII